MKTAVCLALRSAFHSALHTAGTLLYTLLNVLQCGCMTGACLASEGEVAKDCTNGWLAMFQLS